MSIVLRINGIDKTDQVDWQSIEKTEVLTKEPDTMRFSLKNYGSKTYRPELGDEVILSETSVDGPALFDLLAIQGVTHPFLTRSSRIFGGVVIDTKETIAGRLQFFDVNCKDFTHTLDRKLVVKTYESVSAASIVSDIVATFVEAGFTTGSTVAPTTVQKIVFNYLTVSQAFQSLAETLGDHDWYVDYDKDVHFFKPTTINAPFDLTDTSDNFVWNSLIVEENTHQLRNHIVIRGGDIEGDLVSNIQVSDGVQRVFFVGYSLALSSLLIQKALSATPTTFVTQTVGKDGVDNAASFDCLYNPNDGLIIFPNATKPAVDDRIKSEGFPIFPLLAEKSDLASIALHGTFQYLIVDKTIRSKPAASQRADGELEKYANISHRASFTTYTTGLRTGQTINVNSAIRGINQDFRIERISTTFRTPTTLQYSISLLASEDITMVDVLNRLLITSVSDQIEILENEVVDRLFSQEETITLQEVFVAAQGGSPSHHGQTETATATEVSISQPLNYATKFVVGPYIPTIAFNGADKKRLFLVNGSHIASTPEAGLFDLLAVQGVTHAFI